MNFENQDRIQTAVNPELNIDVKLSSHLLILSFPRREGNLEKNNFSTNLPCPNKGICCTSIRTMTLINRTRGVAHLACLA